METRRHRISRLRRLGFGTVAVGMLLAVTGLASTTATADPPGNNGTVKIDGTDLNDGPGHTQKPNDPKDEGTDNDPHVTCGFELEFFNFDTGQTADIEFTAHAPTGKNGLLYSQNHLISDDGTAGAPNDVDEIIPFDVLADFDTSQFTSVHPVHGWHVKLNITVYDALGKKVPGAQKHKVFWVESCAPPPPRTFGSLSVDKVVAGNDQPAPGTQFSFTVVCTTAGGDPIALNAADAAFTLADADAVHLISNLPTGATCVVDETNDQGADSTTWTGGVDNGNGTVTATIGVDTTVAIVATNNFNDTPPPPPPPPPGATTGSLSLYTVVTGDAAVDGAEFAFDIDCSNGLDQSVSLSDTDPAHVVSNLPTGTTCEIVETDDGNATDTTWTGGTAIPGENGVSVTIGNGTTVTVTATNDFELEVLPLPPVVRPPTVTPPVVTPPAPPAPPTKVAGVVIPRSLPRTGTDALPLVELGLGMILLGFGAMLFGRERTALI